MACYCFLALLSLVLICFQNTFSFYTSLSSKTVYNNIAVQSQLILQLQAELRGQSIKDVKIKRAKMILLGSSKSYILFPNFRQLEMVFYYQNCSDILWEKIVLVIEKNFWNSRLKAEKFSKILRSLEQFIQTVKGQNSFW